MEQVMKIRLSDMDTSNLEIRKLIEELLNENCLAIVHKPKDQHVTQFLGSTSIDHVAPKFLLARPNGGGITKEAFTVFDTVHFVWRAVKWDNIIKLYMKREVPQAHV